MSGDLSAGAAPAISTSLVATSLVSIGWRLAPRGVNSKGDSRGARNVIAIRSANDGGPQHGVAHTGRGRHLPVAPHPANSAST